MAEGVAATNILEAGVWRGGASLYAAAVLRRSLARRAAVTSSSSSAAAAVGAATAGSLESLPWTVVLCDSFQGLPLPSSPEDSSWWWSQAKLKVGT